MNVDEIHKMPKKQYYHTELAVDDCHWSPVLYHDSFFKILRNRFYCLQDIRGAKGTPLPRLCFAQLTLAFSYYLCYKKCYVHTYIHTNTHNYIIRRFFPKKVALKILLTHFLRGKILKNKI